MHMFVLDSIFQTGLNKGYIVQNPSDADLLRCRIYRRIIPFCLSGENRYIWICHKDMVYYFSLYLCRLH
jgi:hypothetical protein